MELLSNALLPTLGQAFGAAEAGGTPASGAENAVTKALRSVGYPDVESKVLASAIANKVVSGLQKRILKMEEVLGKIGPSPETSLLQKIHEWICFESCFLTFFLEGTYHYHKTLPSLVWSDFMLRMRDKITELKASLEKSMEKISSDYGNGLVNGFTQEFLGGIYFNLF